MEVSGSFTFSISDQNLDFKDIESNIGLQPTKIVEKGQPITRLTSREAPYDIWLYEKNIYDGEDIMVHLADLLSDLLPYSKYILEISKHYKQVTIDCYLRSNFAQIGFQISHNTISMLEKLDLSLNFHILSFGEVRE